MVKIPAVLGGAAAVLLSITLAAAQPVAPDSNTPEDSIVEPIQCWWRTGASAVRVGELFPVVLTCAVLDTASTTVVPDQSRLDPTVLQLVPFEVTGGVQATDLRTQARRFFQYEYDVRYLGEQFNVDVELPALSISYRVQSRVERADAAIEGRDRQYILPAHQIRILSLVPAGASDIRDRPPDTFRAVESRRFLAQVLTIASFTLFGLGAVLLGWTAVRAVSGGGRPAISSVRLASDASVLRAVVRELTDVGLQRRLTGWTPELSQRAVVALRIAASYAVAGHAAQTPWVAPRPPAEGQPAADGQIVVRSRLRLDRMMLVSGSATAHTVDTEMQRLERAGSGVGSALTELRDALAQFDAVGYGRDSGELDLDDALASATSGAARVWTDHRWRARLRRALVHSSFWTKARAWVR